MAPLVLFMSSRHDQPNENGKDIRRAYPGPRDSKRHRQWNLVWVWDAFQHSHHNRNTSSGYHFLLSFCLDIGIGYWWPLASRRSHAVSLRFNHIAPDTTFCCAIVFERLVQFQPLIVVVLWSCHGNTSQMYMVWRQQGWGGVFPFCPKIYGMTHSKRSNTILTQILHYSVNICPHLVGY